MPDNQPTGTISVKPERVCAGLPVFKVQGREYLFTRHALLRAAEMGLSAHWLLSAIESPDEMLPQHKNSKYAGDDYQYYRRGDVTVVTLRVTREFNHVITVLWATGEAWTAWLNKAKDKTDRKFRPDLYALLKRDGGAPGPQTWDLTG